MLDMGATEVLPPQQLFALRAAARITTDMSDLRAAGYMAVPPAAGFPTPAVSTVEEAKQFVAMRRAEGSDYLKIGLTGVRSATRGVANLDEPMVRALVEAAHANGMLAVAHVETLDDVTVALSAGVDGLMHVWRRGGANAQIARRVAERGVFVSATLVIPDGYLDGRAGLLADPRFLSVLSNPNQGAFEPLLLRPYNRGRCCGTARKSGRSLGCRSKPSRSWGEAADRYRCQSQQPFRPRDQLAPGDGTVQQRWTESFGDSHCGNG
jgi:hypothetical protein